MTSEKTRQAGQVRSEPAARMGTTVPPLQARRQMPAGGGTAERILHTPGALPCTPTTGCGLVPARARARAARVLQ